MTDREKLIEILKASLYGNIDEGFDGPELNCENVADYLLANGVIVPPCKVGDKVYTYGARRVKEWKITFCGKNSRGEYYFRAADDGFKNLLEFWHYEIKQSIFLTKEEAEEKLKELKDNER